MSDSRSPGARHLIVTGCTTSVCVDSTVLDAMFKDYLCVLLADCMSEPIGQGLPRSNPDASLLTYEVVLGWVSDSDRFLKALRTRQLRSIAAPQLGPTPILPGRRATRMANSTSWVTFRAGAPNPISICRGYTAIWATSSSKGWGCRTALEMSAVLEFTCASA